MESPGPAMIIDKVAVPGYLHQERLPFYHFALPIVGLIEQIDVAVLVDPYLAIDQVRNGYGDLTAAGPLRDQVDEFLRKRVEHNASRTLAPFARDCVESGEPVACVCRFPFGPLPDEMNDISHLLPRAVLVPIEHCLRFVPLLERLTSRDTIVERTGINRRLRVGQVLLVFLALLKNQPDIYTVNPSDLPGLHVHFAIEVSVDNQPAKVF